MRPTILADRWCGMNTQAAELLALMSQEIIQIPSGMYISTAPYCNCREMGFAILIGWKGETENIVFFEHRNSDKLCALRWPGSTPIDGSVRVDDIPQEYYPDKWTLTREWDHKDYNSAIEYAKEVIAEIIVRHTTGESNVA